jgi:hypothetical protein
VDRSELRQAVWSRCAVPSTGDGLLDANTVDSLVQRALTDLCNERTWPWLLTSSALTFTDDSAPMPSDCVQVRDLEVNGRRAKRVKFTEWLDQRSWQSSCVWTDVGATIRVSPTPASALTDPTLWYYRNEPELVTEAQEPLMPAQYAPVVIARAAYHANVRRGRMDEARTDEAEWMAGVKRVHDAVSRQIGPSRIRESRPTVWATW